MDSIDVPTMFLHGDVDRILPIDVTARRLKEILKPDKYVETEDAPHGLLWTHADKVSDELLDFLE